MQVQQFLQQAKRSKSAEDNRVAIDIHHLLMKEYGWIPIKEFEEMPIPMILDLVDAIIRDKEAEAKAWKKGNSKKSGRR